MNVDLNDLSVQFVFGEKDDYYFAHVVDSDGNVCIAARFAKDVYTRIAAFTYASNIFSDCC